MQPTLVMSTIWRTACLNTLY